MKETPTQRKAFEYYYSLGDKRNLKEQIQHIQAKLDRLLFIFITAFITLITTALITIIQ